ncbi:plastidial pyruvate kinase 1, chloroplastic-like [Asparagus officinalis]|uniref:plastidial pyruvate kinase 1, chloroplastic-like n=1 Tax=Asparagus officinalis TaxID=4686 RepID=UPI00098E43B8|nr:plastidial pyruvate kinase 1, chloroplastic-like [Asparagus officinalis]
MTQIKKKEIEFRALLKDDDQKMSSTRRVPFQAQQQQATVERATVDREGAGKKTRVADVSEAVRQFADALMLSGESAVGSFADKALAVLCMASARMELSNREENRQSLLVQSQLAVSLPDRISEQICNSAVEMANNLGVDAIFVFTKHGYMASLLSRNRPNPPIFAFTDHPGARKSMNLLWGVIPIELPFSEDIEASIKKTINLMKLRGSVKHGDLVLVVSELSCSSSAPSVIQSIQVKHI